MNSQHGVNTNPPLKATQSDKEQKPFTCTDGTEHIIGKKYDERRGVGNGPQICLNCKETLRNLIAEETNAARIEMALEFTEKLDEANVPNEVRIPELVGDDLNQISVPVVSGEYWVNVHKALKYIREVTLASLKANKEQE